MTGHKLKKIWRSGMINTHTKRKSEREGRTKKWARRECENVKEEGESIIWWGQCERVKV